MARGTNKDRIIDAGLGLLYEKGYNATGIQEIADAAGVPKGSFYNYFKSKEEFAAQVIDRYTKQTVQLLNDRLKNGKDSCLSRMRSLLEEWAETMFVEHRGLGCFVGNISQEMGNQSSKIRAEAKKDFSHLESSFIACLQTAQEQGEISPDIDAKQLGSFIYNGWQGALVRSKSEGNGNQLKGYVEYLFDTLLPRLV